MNGVEAVERRQPFDTSTALWERTHFHQHRSTAAPFREDTDFKANLGWGALTQWKSQPFPTLPKVMERLAPADLWRDSVAIQQSPVAYRPSTEERWRGGSIMSLPRQAAHWVSICQPLSVSPASAPKGIPGGPGCWRWELGPPRFHQASCCVMPSRKRPAYAGQIKSSPQQVSHLLPPGFARIVVLRVASARIHRHRQHFYANQLLKLANTVREKRPWRAPVRLLHDSARPHVTEVKRKIRRAGLGPGPPSPYHLDIAPLSNAYLVSLRHSWRRGNSKLKTLKGRWANSLASSLPASGRGNRWLDHQVEDYSS